MSQATLHERPYQNSALFSGHYLDERVQERDEWDCDDDAREAMEALQALYELEGDLVTSYGEDALIDNWIDEVLDVLGFGTQEEVTLPDGGGYVDELLFESSTARRDAAGVYLDTEDTTDLFERAISVVEAKQWDADFTERFSEQRPYRNASHQIKHYLENTTPNLQWGVLTNGRKWRLYGTNDYETKTYYEVDLPELLERGDLDAFKYFYVFFRPAAFRESAGTTFLDEVWSESETASQELGEDLQDNVFTALRVLGRGFIETNDNLDIDPDDEEALDELKEQSLVLLYRLMFVLYAEARGLIHPESQSAQDDYEENFSLDALRLEIHDEIGEVDEGFDDEFSEYSTGMWSRLEDLFRLIDQGEEDLGIPPYNGGLFDHEEHDFLTEHEVSNRYLAEVIYRLSTTQNGDGRYVLADYADLNTRHLGSVYEGLLEHQFRIAPEQYAAVAEDGGQVWKPATEVSVAEAVETVPEGGLYVVNDEGERKATGAYYTPDYVVTYIVEETVGPRVEEIREDLVDQGFEPGTQEYIGPFFRRVIDLRILDPAMGSGHFLTKATGYLSEQVMAEVREAESEFGVAFDEQHVRREIAKECIYGVDLNGMAVELAKLSMWLETLAADRPLAFLDHHFKEGNSLIGSDIEAIEELESDTNGDGDQYSLAKFGATREGTIERLMDIYSEFLAIENETVEDVQEMKRKYAEIKQDELRRRLVAMANVHTAEQFGVDVPGGAYERMAKALEDDGEWKNVEDADWFASAQSIVDEEDFLHWKLEFPEVFFNESGAELGDSGFDAIIGNPPYIRIQTISGGTPTEAEYYSQQYDSAVGKYDIYVVFIEKGIELMSPYGQFGMIVPNKFIQSNYGSGVRKILIESDTLDRIVDFGDSQVFRGQSTYTSILLLSNPSEGNFHYSEAVGTRLRDLDFNSIEESSLSDDPWNIATGEEAEVLNKLLAKPTKLGDISDEIFQGVITGSDDYFILEKSGRVQESDVLQVSQRGSDQVYEIESELLQPFVKGDGIRRFYAEERDTYLLYPYDDGDGDILSENELKNQYPKAFQYLNGHRDGLESRGSASMDYETWYALWNPRQPWKFNAEKILTPVIAKSGRFCPDSSGTYFNGSGGGGGGGYGIILEDAATISERYVASILNSSVCDFIIKYTSSVFEGEFFAYNRQYIEPLPIPVDNADDVIEVEIPLDLDMGSTCEEVLESCASEYQSAKSELFNLNLNLLDYIQPYVDGDVITDIGIYQPPEGVGDTKLAATKEDYGNLRVGTVTCEREDEKTVVLHATARYKPDDEDAYETDRWGYTETEPMPAMRLTDLSETEGDLVEAFVPVAVEKADGFAGFRETATKTNSLVDRLEAITLPDPDDVADDLERYRDAVERADELDEKIERTDELINDIVYDLYGLTDEEIEIVGDAVASD